MRGNAGDGAIYIDKHGEEHRAIIQSETMNGNANLVYWEDEEPTKESLKMAMNIPHKSDTPNDKSVYRHKPSADWIEELI